MRPFAHFRSFHQNSTDYFGMASREIAADNLLLLRRASIGFTVVLVLYGLFAVAVFHTQMLNIIYLVYTLVNICFMLTVNIWPAKRLLPRGAVHAACILFILLVMSFVTLISVFPFPSRPAIFFSLAYICMTVLFILPLWEISLLMTAIQALFMVLCVLFKTPQSRSYDLFASITSWLLSFFLIYLVLELRLRAFSARNKLRILSMTDDLTGLPNRRAFDTRIRAKFEVCFKKQQPVALLMVDIDNFKKYNDCYGHLAGDECLILIGDAIRDAAGGWGEGAFRYGGEEFCILLAGKNVHNAQKVARDVLQNVFGLPIEAPFNKTGRMTVSVGVSNLTPCDAESFLTLIGQADRALYRAKSNGKNQFAFFKDAQGALTEDHNPPLTKG